MVDITGLFGSFDPVGSYAKGAALRKQWDTDAALKDTFSNMPVGADGKPDYMTAAQKLFAVGATGPGLGLAQLAQAQADKENARSQWQQQFGLQRQQFERQSQNDQRQSDIQKEQLRMQGERLRLEQGRADTSTPQGRAQVAGQYGLRPGTPDYQQYVMNGKIPTAAEKAPTEGQSNAANYANRMIASDKVLADPKIVDAQMSMKERALNKIPLGLGNFVVSSEFQTADQAQRNFINAVLRRESGAVISDAEFENGRKQYFPAPGDSPAVLAQKAANRKDAIDGIASAAGPALKKLETFQGPASPMIGGRQGQPAAAPQSAPAAQPEFKEGQRARNPATGQTLIRRNGQWVAE